MRSRVAPSGPSSVVSGSVAATSASTVSCAELPAASVARTTSECAPSVSTGVVHGDVHGVAARLSTRQLKSTPPSLEPKLSVVVMSASVTWSGPSIVTSGAAVSTRNERMSSAARSFVRTTKMWPPSA